MLRSSVSFLLLASAFIQGQKLQGETREFAGAAKIDLLNDNEESRQADCGLIKFEESALLQGDRGHYNLVFRDDPSHYFRFEHEVGTSNQKPHYSTHGNNQDLAGQIIFQDDNKIANTPIVESSYSNQQKGPKKRRRRRRRPKLVNPMGASEGYPVPGSSVPEQQYSGGLPPGLHDNPVFSQAPFKSPSRRRRRPPSGPSDAISAAIGALTSIARYDDYQCVPRMLCEAAGNGGLNNIATSSILESIVHLQPLLAILSAYNGISTSPLFVFGRAVILGMTSKDNPGTCRYAYPLCPTDPEQLVHYLNNHNGGFFRFFSSPSIGNSQFQSQQNLEQFYNHLSNPSNIQQNYGLYKPGVSRSSLGFRNDPFRYSFQKSLLLNKQPSSNVKYSQLQNNDTFNYIRFNTNNDIKKNNKIEKRILTSKLDSDNNFADIFPTNWMFPESSAYEGKKKLRAYKFPEEVDEVLKYDKKVKTFNFPGAQSNRNYSPGVRNYFSQTKYNDNHYNGFRFGRDDDFKLYDNVNKFHKNPLNSKEEEFELFYIVRGNGDPNHPDVIQLQPDVKVI